jgi:hypothetical protein
VSEAELTIKRGLERRDTGDAPRGTSDIQAGFALYFGIADSQDRALPGWQAMHRALTSEGVEAIDHRNTAKSEWTAIGRLDLVSEWVDQKR